VNARGELHFTPRPIPIEDSPHDAKGTYHTKLMVETLFPVSISLEPCRACRRNSTASAGKHEPHDLAQRGQAMERDEP
jgi:hypothetical protein